MEPHAHLSDDDDTFYFDDGTVYLHGETSARFLKQAMDRIDPLRTTLLELAKEPELRALARVVRGEGRDRYFAALDLYNGVFVPRVHTNTVDPIPDRRVRLDRPRGRNEALLIFGALMLESGFGVCLRLLQFHDDEPFTVLAGTFSAPGSDQWFDTRSVLSDPPVRAEIGFKVEDSRKDVFADVLPSNTNLPPAERSRQVPHQALGRRLEGDRREAVLEIALPKAGGPEPVPLGELAQLGERRLVGHREKRDRVRGAVPGPLDLLVLGDE